MDVPYQLLEPETLRNLVEHFVAREGTDYGLCEVPIEDKISQVIAQLEQGKAAIVFDLASESYDIVPRR